MLFFREIENAIIFGLMVPLEDFGRMLEASAAAATIAWQNFKTEIGNSFANLFANIELEGAKFIEWGKNIAEWIKQGITTSFSSLGNFVMELLLGTGVKFPGIEVAHGQAPDFIGPMQPQDESQGGQGFSIGGLFDDISSFFKSIFPEDQTEAFNESVVEQTDLVDVRNGVIDMLNQNEEALSDTVIGSDSALQKNIHATEILTGTEDLMTTQVDSTRSAFITLENAANALAAKIARTNVSFKKDEEGNIVGFKLSGGISKSDISEFGQSFAHGGIVNSPIRAIVGDSPGGEAIIPLRDLPSILSKSLGEEQSKGNTVINIELSPSINIEGGSNLRVDDIKDIFSEDLAKDLGKKIQELL